MTAQRTARLGSRSPPFWLPGPGIPAAHPPTHRGDWDSAQDPPSPGRGSRVSPDRRWDPRNPPVRVAITALRASAAGLDAAASAAVEYVCGPVRTPRRASAEVSGAPPVTYYADQTIEGPGRWLGHGAPRLGLTGTVDPGRLQALLSGRHPTTGDELIGPRGSNRRAHPTPAAQGSGPGWDQDSYTFKEAAALIDVDASHLRHVAGHTRALLNRTGGSLDTLSAVEADGTKYLLAEQGPDAKWRVTRAELQRFQAQRRPANVVMGFDVTFSAPKSVSILWAAGDAPTRTQISAAIGHAVQAGFEYLERTCAHTGRGSDRIPGKGLAAAAFTHATSRNLDPQLHTHVLVANMLETTSGGHRALDGSGSLRSGQDRRLPRRCHPATRARSSPRRALAATP